MHEFPGGITVLLPVYNGERYLKQAVRSVLNQTYKNFELLIVDDGSTDKSVEIARSFNDSRIRIHKKQHTGLADTLNEGISLSQGEWIARIDSDDIALNNRLELQSSFLAANSELDVIGGNSLYFSESGKIEFAVRVPAEDSLIRKMLDIHNPFNHSAVTFRKNRIVEGGGYDPSFDCYEDFELWHRLRHKLRFAIVPEFLVFTRLRKDSLTSISKPDRIREMLLTNLTALENSGTDEKYTSGLRSKIEYFYGEKVRSREAIIAARDFSKLPELLTTLLPEDVFKKVRDLRLRYRLQTRSDIRNKYGAILSEKLK